MSRPPSSKVGPGALGPLPDFSHADLEAAPDPTAAGARAVPTSASAPPLDDASLARLARRVEGRLRRAYLATQAPLAAEAARRNADALAAVLAARHAALSSPALPPSAPVLDLSAGVAPDAGFEEAVMVAHAHLASACSTVPGLAVPHLAMQRVKTVRVPPRATRADRERWPKTTGPGSKGAPSSTHPDPQRSAPPVPSIQAPPVAPVPPYMSWAYLLRNEVAIDAGKAVYYTDPAGETIAASDDEEEVEEEEEEESSEEEEEEEAESVEGPGGGAKTTPGVKAKGRPDGQPPALSPKSRPVKRGPPTKLDSVWRAGEEWVLGRAAAGPLGGGPRVTAALAAAMRLPREAVARRLRAAAVAAAAARAAAASLQEASAPPTDPGAWSSLPLPPFPLLPPGPAARVLASAVAAARAGGGGGGQASPHHPPLAPVMCRMCRRFACLAHGGLVPDVLALDGGALPAAEGDASQQALLLSPSGTGGGPASPPPPPPPRASASGCGPWCARPGARGAKAARAALAASAASGSSLLAPDQARLLGEMVAAVGPDPCALARFLDLLPREPGGGGALDNRKKAAAASLSSFRGAHRCALAAAWLEGAGLAPAPVAGHRVSSRGGASAGASARPPATAATTATPPPTAPVSPDTAAAAGGIDDPGCDLSETAAAAAKARAAAAAVRAKRGAQKIANKRKRELLGPLWPVYTPCNCVGGCKPDTCPCHGKSNYCEKFCGCAQDHGGVAGRPAAGADGGHGGCEFRFRGCQCSGGCATRACPCLASKRECDPDLCRKCVDWGGRAAAARAAGEAGKAAAASARAAAAAAAAAPPAALVAAGLALPAPPPPPPSSTAPPPPPTLGDVITCANGRVRRGEHKRLAVGLSSIIGWGAYALEPVSKGDLLGEYTGDLITQEEANRRGKAYDRDDNSYLFDLTLSTVIDARRRGNKLRFVNHDAARPNCQPEIRLVDGEARIGLIASKDIPVGGEIMFNYGYEQANWQADKD